MATAVTSTELEAGQSTGQSVINDLVIKVATVNGSGSQSSNTVLVRALFTMGIPCCGKNLFPSNIQGLPTWYILRANEKGWLGHRRKVDVFVAMNPASLVDDVASLEPGAILVIDATFKALVERDDILVFAVPFSRLVKEICEDTRRRKMVINIMYVGVLASLLGIAQEDVHAAIDWQFSTKVKVAQMNKEALTYAFNWAEESLPSQDRVRVERRDMTEGKILIEGNECVALGLMFGGISVAAWYPITPSSSVCEVLTTYLEKYRIDEDSGKPTFAVIQAEDELSAMSIVLGAGWAGARAATATSGPGLSLMAELAGLSYFAEIPAVIIDVQRMGPSTGLPTRNAQGDLMFAYNLSHGDCKHPVLLPGNMTECYEFALEAMDLAEQLQTLVLMLSDLDLGMNRWVTEPLKYPEKPINRGKVLDVAELEKHIERYKSFARYRDVDGDGICYRTRPGTEHPEAAYFTRGTGHTEEGGYSEKEENWVALMDRLSKKFETIRKILPAPVTLESTPPAEVGVIAFGSSDPAVQEAQVLLSERAGLPVDYLRIRALPPNEDVRRFIGSHRVTYVVEQNRDGQMAGILSMEFPEIAPKLRKVRHYDGMPLDAETVISQILASESK